MQSFSDKIVFITGGATGIGKATAKLFLEYGAHVVITARDKTRGEQTAKELSGGADEILYVQADARSAEQTAWAFAECDRAFGGVDILFNNAGVNCVGAVDILSEADWDACLDTNLKGAFLASREAVPRMRVRGGGVIINDASNSGLIARANDPVYCASKAGLVMLTRAMALAHAADRIRVNAVCPGPVSDTLLMETNLVNAADREAETRRYINAAPMAAAWARMISPKEVAEMVVYLSSDAAQMVTGAVIPIDGGKSAGIP